MRAVVEAQGHRRLRGVDPEDDSGEEAAEDAEGGKRLKEGDGRGEPAWEADEEGQPT
jgi:hypothetical protein